MMRLLFGLLLLAACSKDRVAAPLPTTTGSSASPDAAVWSSAERELVKQDLELFCATDLSTPMSEYGPIWERDMKSDEFRRLVQMMKSGTNPREALPILEALNSGFGLATCPALDQLRARQ